MASDTDYKRLRLDLGLAATDTTSLPDATAEDIFDEVEESYTDAASIHAATRVIAIERLLMQASADVDYVQNNTQEKASQRAIALEKRLIDWRKKLIDAVGAASGSGTARFGKPTRKPARIKEHPNGGWGSWGW